MRRPVRRAEGQDNKIPQRKGFSGVSATMRDEDLSLEIAVYRRIGLRVSSQLSGDYARNGWTYQGRVQNVPCQCHRGSASNEAQGGLFVWRKPFNHVPDPYWAIFCQLCRDVKSIEQFEARAGRRLKEWAVEHPLPESWETSESEERAVELGVTRLCHFTRLTALREIIATGEIRSHRRVRDSSRISRAEIINDPRRLDHHRDHVNCSIQYPNLLTLNKFKNDSPNERWIILLLGVMLLSKPYTKFSPSNAAHESGRNALEGLNAYKAMYEDPVRSAQGLRSRGNGHLDKCPTDIQAEALIHGTISIQHVEHIVMENSEDFDVVTEELVRWPGERPKLHEEEWFFDYPTVISKIRGESWI